MSTTVRSLFLNRRILLPSRHELSSGLAAVDTTVAAAPVACPADQVRKDTVRVAPIQVDDPSLLPEEYRVLVYEHLIEQLKREKTLQAVYRDGDQDPAAQCAEYSLTLAIERIQERESDFAGINRPARNFHRDNFL